MGKYVVCIFLIALGVVQNWDRIATRFGKQPAAAEKEVVLYANEWCGYCKLTREFLAEQGIGYTEFDIEKSSLAREEFRRLGGRGTPLVTVNGVVIRGHNPKAILAELERR